MNTQANHQLAPGTQLLPYAYRITRTLGEGEGRMASLYLATITCQDAPWLAGTSDERHEVVLKIANRPDAQGNFFTAALAQEVQLLRGLHHPHLVRLLPIVQQQDARFTFIAQADLPGYPRFAVLEYLPYGSLATLLAANEAPLPLWVTLEIGYTVAVTLDYLHRCGLVHLDLKPRNLLFRQPYFWPTEAKPNRSQVAGEIVLIDFGSATTSGRIRPTQEATFRPVVYLPPEWIQAVHTGELLVQPGLDLYAFGVILYKMMTGRLPFVAQDPYDLERAILAEEPPPPSHWWPPTVKAAPRLQTLLDGLVLAALQKNPRHRYTASQLADGLQEARLLLPSPVWLDKRPGLVGRDGHGDRSSRHPNMGRRRATLIFLAGVGMGAVATVPLATRLPGVGVATPAPPTSTASLAPPTPRPTPRPTPSVTATATRLPTVTPTMVATSTASASPTYIFLEPPLIPPTSTP